MNARWEAAPGAMKALENTSPLKFFLAAFGIPWLLFPLMYYLGVGLLGVVIMFAPAIGAIWAGHKERPDISLSVFKAAFYAFIWIALAITITAPLQTPGYRLGEFLAFIYSRLGIPEDVAKEMAKVGEIQNLLTPLILPAAIFVNAFVAFGEEYGWRSYLTPLLARRLGWIGASVVVGIIWGLWHAPVILLGHNYMEKFWLPGAFLFAIFTVPASLVHTYAYLKYGTWGAAALHGAINALANYYFFFYLPNPVWLYNPAGVIGGLAWTPLALYAAIKIHQNQKFLKSLSQDLVSPTIAMANRCAKCFSVIYNTPQRLDVNALWRAMWQS